MDTDKTTKPIIINTNTSEISEISQEQEQEKVITGDNNNSNNIGQDVNYHINLINAFTIYYKKLHKIENHDSFSFLDAVDYTDPLSTNTIMEDFYGHVIKYKESMHDHALINLYDHDDKNINYTKEKELYELIM